MELETAKYTKHAKKQRKSPFQFAMPASCFRVISCVSWFNCFICIFTPVRKGNRKIFGGPIFAISAPAAREDARPTKIKNRRRKSTSSGGS